MTVATSIALALALAAAPDGICAPPGDADRCAPAPAAVSPRLAALLGSIDRPVTREQWRALPAADQQVLRAVAADAATFATLRARALEGLAALDETSLHRELAGDAALPYVVRRAAVRGLGALPDAGERASTLSALLASDPDRRIRAAAATALSGSTPGGCDTVREQARRDGVEGQRLFRRALAACAERP